MASFKRVFMRFFTKDQEGRFHVLTLEWWRTLFTVFCVFCWVGHWLEIPYCTFMSQFGIVADDYAVWVEPWFTPYWVYGIGAVAMTLVIEPFREDVIAKRRTTWGAVLETFAYTVAVAAVLETVIGLIINQPDAAGVYPYWDNSQLPLNILGQGWLVNDLVIGVMAILYLWVFYPAIDAWLRSLRPWVANTVCVALVALIVVAALLSYL